MRKKISNVMDALFLSVILIVVLNVFWYCTWESNDDAGMMKTISGYGAGVPVWDHPYISIVIGKVLYFLQILFPEMCWYTIYSYCVLIICYTVIFYTLMKKIERCKMDGVFYAIVLVLFTGLFMIYPATRISFTVNSALCGMASILMLLEIRESDDTIKVSRIKWGIAIGLIILCALIRFASFEAILPFWLLVYGYIIVRCNKQAVIKAIVCLLVFLTILFVGNEVESRYRYNVIESESYLEYQVYRGYFSDFPILPYYGNEEFYDSIGWDEEFFIMTRDWYYLDERFNTENLKSIVEASNFEKNQSETRLVDSVSLLFDTIFANKLQLMICVLALLVFGVAIYRMFRNEYDNRWQFWVEIFAVGGFFLEILYLCWKGRFVYRAFLCAALPMSAIGIWGIIGFVGKIKNKRIVNFVGLFACCMVAICLSKTLFYPGVNVGLQMVNSQANDVDAYCSRYPNNFYVYDSTLVNDTRLWVDGDVNAKNRMFWGGSSTYSSAFYEVLEMNGFEDFFTDNFLDDNVYYITLVVNVMDSKFGQYVQKYFGPEVVIDEVACTSSGVRVYKVRMQEDSTMPVN